MRSHRFINSLLYLVIQLVEKESKVNENNAGIRHFFVLFLGKRYISQVIHFNSSMVWDRNCVEFMYLEPQNLMLIQQNM